MRIGAPSARIKHVCERGVVCLLISISEIHKRKNRGVRGGCEGEGCEGGRNRAAAADDEHVDKVAAANKRYRDRASGPGLSALVDHGTPSVG